MRRTRLAATSILAASALLAGAGAATAADQTVEGTVVSSMDLVLSNVTPTANLSIGANTIPAGTLTVKTNSTTASVTVSFSKTKMTEYANGAYGTATLDGDLTLAALSGGTSVGTASSSTGGTLLAANLLTVGDSVFDLSFTQPVLSTDKVATYRNVVTYTAATL